MVAARDSLKKNRSQRRDVNAGSRQHTQGAGSEEIATTSNEPRSTRKRIPVKGARRVWDTVKTATAIAVKTTIKQLTTVGEGVLVKRKYKTAGDESKCIVRWWFVVSGEEETLQLLQKEWSQIGAQRVWKLEPLYSYGESVSVSHSSLTDHQQFPIQTPHYTAQLQCNPSKQSINNT